MCQYPHKPFSDYILKYQSVPMHVMYILNTIILFGFPFQCIQMNEVAQIYIHCVYDIRINEKKSNVALE